MKRQASALALACLAVPAWGQQDPGLVGHWAFDEGRGTVVRDLSGHGNDGVLHGGTFVGRGSGYALKLDGVDDYVDCGDGPSLDLTATVSLEGWVKPEALPAKEPLVFGKYYDSFGLTHYRDGNAWFYISGGGNNVKGRLELGQWNHVAATFDGTDMTLYINRQKVAQRKSKAGSIAHGKNFLMGVLKADPTATDPGYGATAHWRGQLDDVRVYSRVLGEPEILGKYKQTAAGYGVDTTWFDRLRVLDYPFRVEQRLVSLLDFSGVFPLPPGAALKAELTQEGSAEPVRTQEWRDLPSSGRLCATFSLADLPPGEYAVAAHLSAPPELAISGREKLRLPLPTLPVPDPSQTQVGSLPPEAQVAKYSLELAPGGGFTLAIGGQQYPFESSFSFPHGGENKLVAGAPDRTGEPEWRVSTRKLGARGREVIGRGKHYTVTRHLEPQPRRVLVKDTIRNTSDADLGVIVDSHLAAPRPFEHTAVAGYLEATERKEACSPSSFVTWPGLGIGLVPLDDVFIVHSTVYARDGRAGLRDDRFGLPPGQEYTLEWAVYPVASSDYYDFVNFVRRDEGRNGTVEGGFAFIDRRNVRPEDVRLRNLRYGSFGCLTHVADDPEIEIEGIDFLWLPKERARIKAEFDNIRKANPGLKLMFHLAHSLVSTNKPEEMFADSRVLDAQGKQVIYPYDYEACAYFSRQRHEEGWRWYIYYPTPGNSFHEALLKSVDVMVDDIGCNGAFMDGFFIGYGSPYTYDRWDGHTVEMDLETNTIKRKVGSVLLLSQPSMVEFAQRMHARGAVVVANNLVVTRTIGRLPLVTDQECRSGPDVHLAQTPCALGNPTVIHNESDVYTDVLDKLSWGTLYFYYGEGRLTYPSLPQQMFPITIESIHAGTVKGKERIVTMRSGVYGWADGRELHQGYRYNPVGVMVPAEFLTTVDASGVRTQVELEPQESAVVRRLPVVLEAPKPVNVRPEKYDASGLVLSVNGQGRAELRLRDGELRVELGARFKVSTSALPLVAGRGGILRVPLVLQGQTQVSVEPVSGERHRG